MDKQGYPINFAFNERQKNQIWDNALVLKPDEPDLPDSFFHEEWEKVIQPQNVNSLEDYFKARRLRGGVQLNRTLRKSVWPVLKIIAWV